MMLGRLLSVIVSVLLFGCVTERPDSSNLTAVGDAAETFGFAYEVEDAAFAKTVDTSSAVEVLATGFTWSEGPVWVPALNALLFSDVPGNVVYQRSRDASYTLDLSRPDAVQGVDTFFYPAGYFEDPDILGEAGANGLILSQTGELVLAQHGERQLAKWTELPGQGFRLQTGLTPANAFERLATAYDGKRFNSPNDVAQLSDGDYLFTDPTYGVDKTFGEEARELPFAGVYRVDAETGGVSLLLSDMSRPNGIVTTPGGEHVIVANSDPTRALLRKCKLKGLSPSTADAQCEIFADVTSEVGPDRPGNCDGMVMLPSGVLLATGPGGVLCFSESGRHLGTIRTGRATANVTTGGVDGRDIFITADDLLLRARLKQ